MELPKVKLNLIGFCKVQTEQRMAKQVFYDMVRSKYELCTSIYTDGSKREERVVAALVCRESVKDVTLPDVANIHTEVYATGMPVQHVKEQGVGIDELYLVIPAAFYLR